MTNNGTSQLEKLLQDKVVEFKLRESIAELSRDKRLRQVLDAQAERLVEGGHLDETHANINTFLCLSFLSELSLKNIITINKE